MTAPLTTRVRAAARRLFAGANFVMPEGADLYFDWFVALHETRGLGFSGPLAISFQEIEAYARLMRLPLEPHHVALIRAIDREWINRAYQQEGGTRTNGAPQPTRAAQPVNPAAFDAVFS